MTLPSGNVYCVLPGGPPVPAMGDQARGVGAAELAHEALDHAVEREPVVEAGRRGSLKFDVVIGN